MIASRFISRAAVLACVLWVNISSIAKADLRPPAPKDDRERKTAAEALFEAGKDLVARDSILEGCAKFEESQELDAGIGTQFHLADCYERLGRLASAYALFMEVAAATHQRGQVEREVVARERATELKPRLSRLVIVVDRTKAPPGMSVARNGTPVGAAQWGVAIPVDPGEVHVTVTAPDKRALEISVTVRDEGRFERIEIPGLQPLQAHAFAPDAFDARPAPFWDQPKNWVGTGLVGLGVVGVGLFSYFGLESADKYSETDASCTPDDRCSPDAVGTRRDAYHAGQVANVSLGAGVACLAAGNILLWLVPDSNERIRTNAMVGPGLYGATIQGAF
jgi:hypothetical protein